MGNTFQPTEPPEPPSLTASVQDLIAGTKDFPKNPNVPGEEMPSLESDSWLAKERERDMQAFAESYVKPTDTSKPSHSTANGQLAPPTSPKVVTLSQLAGGTPIVSRRISMVSEDGQAGLSSADTSTDHEEEAFLNSDDEFATDLHAQYGHVMPSTEYIQPAPEPPLIPPHFSEILLNSTIKHADPYLLPAPQHVTVNHIYVKSSPLSTDVLVLGITQRYKTKFITTVFYKPKPDVPTAST